MPGGGGKLLGGGGGGGEALSTIGERGRRRDGKRDVVVGKNSTVCMQEWNKSRQPK